MRHSGRKCAGRIEAALLRAQAGQLYAAKTHVQSVDSHKWAKIGRRTHLQPVGSSTGEHPCCARTAKCANFCLVASASHLHRTSRPAMGGRGMRPPLLEVLSLILAANDVREPFSRLLTLCKAFRLSYLCPHPLRKAEERWRLRLADDTQYPSPVTFISLSFLFEQSILQVFGSSSR